MGFKKEKFSKTLKEIIDSYGSINKMAVKTELSASYISRLIRLQYNNPPAPEILRKIADNSNYITNYITLMYLCGYLNDNECGYFNNLKSNINNYEITYYSMNFKEHFIQYNKLNKVAQKKIDDYIQDLIYTNRYFKEN